jgi:HAE1 family hydrophobic/amphiphilic exporter-1
MLVWPAMRNIGLRPGSMRDFVLFRASEHAYQRTQHVYHGLLVRTLRRPLPLFVGVGLLLVASGFWLTQLRSGLMPERSSGDMRLELELPAGTPLSETAEATAALAHWIEADPAVRKVFTQVGRTETTLAAMEHYVAPHTARMRILLHPSRSAHQEGLRLQQEITQRIAMLDGVQYAFREEGVGIGEILQTDGASFQLGVLAEDPLEALRAAEQIQGALLQVPGLVDLSVDRVLGTPNVVVRIDREEALRSGLNPEDLSRQLQARIAGIEATTFNEIEQRIDISVRFPYEQRTELTATLDAPVKLANGQTVPLKAFLQLEEQLPVRELMRHNQRRMVMIGGDVQGRGLDDVWSDVRQAIDGLELPANLRVIEAGERTEVSASFRNLGMAMILAVILVYMILAAQFESFLDPLLIAAVLPIGIAGAVIAMGMTGQTLNILSMIGAVSLIGIAVNDAIVKVDSIRQLREGGMDGTEAILEASRIRFRPIVMNSVTAALGMVPMAIGIGSGEQLQRPLAITIIGGLTLTTALTLFVTPALYQWAHGVRKPAAGA